MQLSLYNTYTSTHTYARTHTHMNTHTEADNMYIHIHKLIAVFTHES